LIAWAEQLGMNQAVQLLKQTLEEEKKTDAALNKLAEARSIARRLSHNHPKRFGDKPQIARIVSG